MVPEEMAALSRYFPTTDCMVGVVDSLVVGRYSVLPFYADVERGLRLQGSRLVNSLREHEYIANFEYYDELEGLTPKTWFRLVDVPKNGGPFVVKGVTNSRKHQWNTHMYAQTYDDVVRIFGDLGNDMFLGSQALIVREYVPLVTLEVGINGLPLANEWRCFYYGQKRLSYGFYWTMSEKRGVITEEGLALAAAAAAKVAEHATFFAVDIAEKKEGGWTVIEVNDGQMSGLSDNDPEVLFKRLRRAMDLAILDIARRDHHDRAQK